MAKLSARGRTELARVSKVFTIPADEWGPTRDYTEKRALMSDRKVLINRGHGWNVAGTLKKSITAEEWLAKRIAEGWVQIKR